MQVRLFPSGRVHSAYLDMVKYPPKGIEYVGDFSYAVGTSVDFFGKGTAAYAADMLGLPYVFPVKSNHLVHSCQKLLSTEANYVIDIEHGNPFMGAANIHKHNYPHFRWITKYLLNKSNCKMLMPWTNIAKEAFELNFSFLGKDFMNDKLTVVYPATYPFYGKITRFIDFTFIFVAGRSFFAKGGVATLEAFKKLIINVPDAKLLVVGATPDHIKMRYADVEGVTFYSHIDRDILMGIIAKCHCLLLPSMGDTFGMIIIEAKAREVPAIIVDSFSAKEIVEHNVTGMLVDPDKNVIPWFDDKGRKRLNKTVFHEQFEKYTPSHEHVMKLFNTMYKMARSKNSAILMGENAKREVDVGRFSIEERNRKLKEIYEAAE